MINNNDPRIKNWQNTKARYEKLLLTCSKQEQGWFKARIDACDRLLSNVEQVLEMVR